MHFDFGYWSPLPMKIEKSINHSKHRSIRNPLLTAKVIFIASIPPFNRLYMGAFSHGSSVLLRLFVNTTVPKVVPILFGNYKAFGPPTRRYNLKKSLLSFQFAFGLASFWLCLSGICDLIMCSSSEQDKFLRLNHKINDLHFRNCELFWNNEALWSQ